MSDIPRYLKQSNPTCLQVPDVGDLTTQLDPTGRLVDLSTDNAGTANALDCQLTNGLHAIDGDLPDWGDVPSIPNNGTIPVPDVSNLLPPSLKTLTDGVGSVKGSGVFDVMMSAVKAQLTGMYEADNLDDTAIATNLVQMMPAVMQQAVEFTIGSAQAAAQVALTNQETQAAYWKAVESQAEAYVANAEIYQTRIQAGVALSQMRLEASNVAVTKMKTLLLNQEANMAKLNAEIQNAQIRDTLSDGSKIAGMLGQQLKLYQAQSRAYDLDGKIKASTTITNTLQTFIANGTIDKVPDMLNEDMTNKVLNVLYTDSGLLGKPGIDGD